MTPQSAALACHPDTPSNAVRGIDVSVGSPDSGTLSLTFQLEGDLTRVRVPPPAPPRRVEGLWRHTCFEAFIAVSGSPSYHEVNLAPSGEWAAYAFSRYRDRGGSEPDFDLRITVRSTQDRLQLHAVIPLGLFLFPASQPLRLALSAVVEEEPGTLTYWALEHPPGRPDFHHPDGFTLQFTLP